MKKTLAQIQKFSIDFEFCLHDIENRDTNTCARLNQLCQQGKIVRVGKKKSSKGTYNLMHFRRAGEIKTSNIWEHVFPEFYRIPDFMVLGKTIHDGSSK